MNSTIKFSWPKQAPAVAELTLTPAMQELFKHHFEIEMMQGTAQAMEAGMVKHCIEITDQSRAAMLQSFCLRVIFIDNIILS